MLSINDFIEKQIIVITSDEFKEIILKNDNLAIYENEQLINQISCYKIFCIFVVWDCSITTKIVNKLLEFWISIYFLNHNLKPKFLIGNQLEWNYLLREKQYNFNKEIHLSKIIIKNKTINQLELLKGIRWKEIELKDSIKKIQELINKIDEVEDSDSLRGIEWNVARIFFWLYYK